MKNLLYKEYLLHRFSLLVGILIFLLLGALNVDSVLFGATVWAMTFVSSSTEDKNNNHLFVNSLPVRRSEVVRAKYVFPF